MSRLLIVNILDRKEKIMAEWVEKSLGEIAEVTKLAGFEFTKYIKYNDDGEIIALRALNLRNGEIDLTDIKRISREVSDGLTRSKIYKDDILLTYTGNGYGDCAIIEENDKYHLAPNICKIVPNTEAVFPYYLYCYIRSKAFYNQMSNNMTGSRQPTIPMKTIRLLKIPIPEMDVQVNIANMIWSLNQKIRNNKAINNNLEQQAQAIFKSWFVDYIPFNGTKPDRWENISVYELAEYINGAAFKKNEYADKGLPIIKITELKNGISDATQYCCTEKDVKYYIDDRDILFSWSGNPDTSIDTFLWSNGKAILNQHTFRVVSKYNAPAFTFFLLKYLKPRFTHIASNKQTTGLGHVTVADLKRLQFCADENAIRKFNAITMPFFDMIFSNYKENQYLSSLRDTILPQLMSGELDVSDIKI